MTNKELIIKLLNTDLDAECNIKKTIGNINFKPEIVGSWVRDGQHAVRCDRCGCRVSNKAYIVMNYCFNCGAKMGANNGM